MIARRDPTYRLLHRELVLLVALAATATAVFFLTRWFADANAAQHRRDASAWYERGRAALQAGESTRAVAALRRASRLDPRRRETGFALATAYAAAGDDGEARRLLAGLREASPDDVEVNLELARLEARSGDLALATRYYHAAADALWRVEQAPQRRPIRIELIKWLLARGDTSRAVPLMVANLLSFVISRRFQPAPVYHALLKQDGVELPAARG